MKKIISILAITILFSCSSHKNTKDIDNSEIGLSLSNKHKQIEDGILVGKAKRTDLQQIPFNDWFAQGYNNYVINEEMEDKIEKELKDYTITIFMGTWCEDSQNQVPKFYKILEEVDFPLRKVTLITMKRDKTTPEQFEKGLNITNVPTFIFYKNGKEVNRIVESPRVSLEQDVIDILYGNNYKHIYIQ
ncbi:thioredoxin family protein [Flavobacterium sp.]|jgi:thiol-disulfide isomerase/thioredoxin|uniref:thioredoxin family protein n=1 Tax=Flavobacterium sp. TaxID=239 RepID=UPI002A81C0DD|nr:thioredoxin family protein [Flavobacterium sp.]